MGRIVLEQVTKSFGETQVIPPLDLTIEDGEFAVFVGPSGCGKSTLLRVIAGLEDATSGKVFIDEKVEKYILRLVDATRHPSRHGLDLERYLRFGASPRASIYLSLAARGHALMQGRDYTTPQDVKDVAHDILRHRMAISYRAEAESLTSDDLLDRILKQVPVTD